MISEYSYAWHKERMARWHLAPQVRKEEGAELLRSLGAEHVVVTSK